MFKRVALAISAFVLLFICFQNFERIPGIPRIVELPLGLTAEGIQLPANETLDPSLIELGNLLFFDKRLSKGAVMACATCHVPANGYAAKTVNKGVTGELMERTTPPATNRLYGTKNNWIGQNTLEAQSTIPITNPIEMGLTQSQLISVVSSIPGYKERFDRLLASGRVKSPAISLNNIRLALATFQRSLLTANSRVDRYEAGDTSALNATEIAGRKLFHGKARCVLCHNGPNYTNEQFHNIASGCPPPPGKCKMPTPTFEAGRYLVTKKKADLGKFKTPSLRNVALRAPYMHHGHDKDLKTVVHGYNVAGDLDDVINQDPLLVNLGLTAAQEDQLVAFLKALTGTIPKDPVLSVDGTNNSPDSREHYLLSPDVFNLSTYKSRYGSSQGLANMTDEQIKNHWIKVGAPSGLMGNTTFNVKEYLNLYPATGLAVTDYLEGIRHYLDYGRAAGWVGRYELHPGFFESVSYRKLYQSSIGTLTHIQAINNYLGAGQKEKRAGRSSPKGYFVVSDVGYFYTSGGRYCQYANASEFKKGLGRSDGRGYPRLDYLPPNITKSGACGTARPPL